MFPTLESGLLVRTKAFNQIIAVSHLFLLKKEWTHGCFPKCLFFYFVIIIDLFVKSILMGTCFMYIHVMNSFDFDQVGKIAFWLIFFTTPTPPFHECISIFCGSMIFSPNKISKLNVLFFQYAGYKRSVQRSIHFTPLEAVESW